MRDEEIQKVGSTVRTRDRNLLTSNTSLHPSSLLDFSLSTLLDRTFDQQYLIYSNEMCLFSRLSKEV